MADERRNARLPLDLVAVATLVAAVFVSTLAPVVSETPVRTVVGLAFALFAPGYAFVAALFPESGDEGGIDGVERVALAVGTSVALVPLVGLALNFTPWGIRLVPVVVALCGLTVALLAAAAVRRNRLPPERRFAVPVGTRVRDARRTMLEPTDRVDVALNVLLIASVVLAAASVAYAVAVPRDGEAFTELYLLAENENGTLVADGYPRNFTVGEGRPLVVGVGNHEGEPATYTVVVELQRVENASGGPTVTARDRLATFRPRVGANETWHRRHRVVPTMTGPRLRLQYLLYRGDGPAYRRVHLWITVRSADATNDTARARNDSLTLSGERDKGALPVAQREGRVSP